MDHDFGAGREGFTLFCLVFLLVGLSLFASSIGVAFDGFRRD
ncbi:hypothetical protein P8A22_17910 [Streptomyces laculatispora]|uniref:Uncharacterized protein n=1 Tax=Streptomyces laculatispora TaxID=887464 RepID=A0ABY9I5C3_9ACTN|nr:hypothetical protein [Streptomyces laculatispora]WLQ41696.1 hypothetical protein P8A22_17910 [Streptomyces laculatispora]